MRNATWMFLLVACLAASSTLGGENWTQFRGPDGQGHTAAEGLPLTWSETENVTWKTAIPGKGWSSPVTWGNQIWLTTALDDGRSLRAVCVDGKSGRIVHNIEIFQPEKPAPINGKNSYASPTPAIEQGRLYVSFGALGTACVDTASGETLWRNEELLLDHKEGAGSSPILAGKLLLLHCDGVDVQYLAAVDKDTGKVAWKQARSGKLHETPDFRKAYATPLVVQSEGRWLVVSPAADHVYAYDLATGEERWVVRYNGFSNVPRPIFGHGLVYVCTGYMKPELWAIRPNGKGDATTTGVAWKCSRQVPANPSPVLVGGDLYMVSDQGVATCLDALTGEPRWQKRLGGSFSASLLAAPGRIYATSEDGVTSVLKPGAESEPLAVNRLDGRILASPAVLDQSLILRTETHLYRLDGVPAAAAAGQ